MTDQTLTESAMFQLAVNIGRRGNNKRPSRQPSRKRRGLGDISSKSDALGSIGAMVLADLEFWEKSRHRYDQPRFTPAGVNIFVSENRQVLGTRIMDISGVWPECAQMLEQRGITHVAHLFERTQDDIMKTPNFDKMSWDAIGRFLESHGLEHVDSAVFTGGDVWSE